MMEQKENNQNKRKQKKSSLENLVELALFFNSNKELQKTFKLGLLNLLFAPAIFFILGMNLLSFFVYLVISTNILFAMLKNFHKAYKEKKETEKNINEVIDSLFNTK